MFKSLSCLFIVLTLNFYAFGQTQPAMSDTDRIRIAEAFRLANKLQNKLWKDWDKTPFSLLLVTEKNEFLINHPKPGDEFESLGYDKMLKSEVFVRPRKFQPHFLATFPAFGMGPVVIVGQAENTDAKTSTPWVITVLHEHFHQLQFSNSTYNSDVNSLNLANGDETGMWQLNFPFPYKKQEIAEQFKKLSLKLLDTYRSAGTPGFKGKLAEYISERKAFMEKIKGADYRYASFQLWQEGIARYTQVKMAELAAKKIKPGRDFARLPDFTSYSSEAERLLKGTLDALKNADMQTLERTVFYAYGATEGLMLDKVNPKWRDRYFVDKFALEKFLDSK